MWACRVWSVGEKWHGSPWKCSLVIYSLRPPHPDGALPCPLPADSLQLLQMLTALWR